MTIENEFAKRDWISQLWEETRHDVAAREFLFGEILDHISEDLPEDARKKIESEMIDDPPDALIEKVTDLLVDDPPDILVDRIKESLRETMEQEFSDKIEDLRMEIAKLKGEEYEPPEPPRAPKIAKSSRKVWR